MGCNKTFINILIIKYFLTYFALLANMKKYLPPPEIAEIARHWMPNANDEVLKGSYR